MGVAPDIDVKPQIIATQQAEEESF
jgi:hypothetical protein